VCNVQVFNDTQNTGIYKLLTAALQVTTTEKESIAVHTADVLTTTKYIYIFINFSI
jgi:hypothetical protein